MAKIGTAHVEVKPVLDERALARLEERIETAVAAAVARGLAASSDRPHEIEFDADGTHRCIRCHASSIGLAPALPCPAPARTV